MKKRIPGKPVIERLLELDPLERAYFSASVDRPIEELTNAELGRGRYGGFMPAPDYVIDALRHAVGERALAVVTVARSALDAPSPNLGDDEMRAADADVGILWALRGDIDDPEGYPPDVVAACALRWALLL